MNRQLISGTVAPGFEEVERQFRRNFAERGEIGAACAVYHRGEKVVDLWGGFRDHRSKAPWEEDTLVLVFSTTKGLAAMAMAVAHSRGLLDYNEQVAAYWPEFAAAGKGEVTVAQLLSHQAGLCVIDEPLTVDTLNDLNAVAELVGKQAPAWEPGSRHGYHGMSLGFYQGELIRRVDPEGRSLGKFFQDETAKPLGLEFYIGLPDDLPEERVATIKDWHPMQMVFHLKKLPWPFVKAFMKKGSVTERTFSNPATKRPADFAKREYLSVEIPSGNGVGLVSSIAKAYGVFATRGVELNLKEETLTALTTPMPTPTEGALDEVFRVDKSYSMGFSKPCSSFEFGCGDSSFGAPGAGGSFAFADPDKQIGFAYAMNRMGFYLWDDPREKALRGTLYRCLGE